MQDSKLIHLLTPYYETVVMCTDKIVEALDREETKVTLIDKGYVALNNDTRVLRFTVNEELYKLVDKRILYNGVLYTGRMMKRCSSL